MVKIRSSMEEYVPTRQDLYANFKQSIKTALKDYARHTYQYDVLEDVSPDFINTLAWSAAGSKLELAKMMSKSPCWSKDLCAWVINGNRTHDPDWDNVSYFAEMCLYVPLHLTVREVMGDMYNKMTEDEIFEARRELAEHKELIRKAIEWFSCPYNSEQYRQECLEALQKLAPNAYHEGRKTSKIFRMFCQAVGVADETAGSDFQKWYARFADEISAKQIGFKLYVSINPAHFVTMSNPKDDERGSMLTSCHSFNQTEYGFNCGCTGYARDGVTMIAFTVDDPTDAESLNNRKTSRQLYMYKPGNGVLLQSRMYNTEGGSWGAQEETKLYRDLIEREIAACEGFNNLWTVKPSSETLDYTVTGRGFGGYPDWTYTRDFDPHICIQKDVEREGNWEVLSIGTYGLCVKCGCDIHKGMYCEDCESETHFCQVCDEEYDESDFDTDITIYDEYGNELDYVCPWCLEHYFTQCADCGNYYANETRWTDREGNEIGFAVVEGIGTVCGDCLTTVPWHGNPCYTRCADCRRWRLTEDMYIVTDAEGHEKQVGECCIHNYSQCDDCDGWYSSELLAEAWSWRRQRRQVCPSCLDSYYWECPHCGAYLSLDIDSDETCPNCGVILEEEDEAV